MYRQRKVSTDSRQKKKTAETVNVMNFKQLLDETEIDVKNYLFIEDRCVRNFPYHMAGASPKATPPKAGAS